MEVDLKAEIMHSDEATSGGRGLKGGRSPRGEALLNESGQDGASARY